MKIFRIFKETFPYSILFIMALGILIVTGLPLFSEGDNPITNNQSSLILLGLILTLAIFFFSFAQIWVSMKDDIREMRYDIKEMKKDIGEMKDDMKGMKEDMKAIKEILIKFKDRFKIK